MNNKFVVKQLFANDWKIWQTIRLEALKIEGDTFGQTYEEAVLQTQHDFQNTLTNDCVFVAIIDNQPIGCICLETSKLARVKHYAKIYSMYVSPNYRGQNIADHLMSAIFEYAVNHNISHLYLSVHDANLTAIKFYKKHNFINYGIMPQALKINNKLCDINLMFLKLNEMDSSTNKP